MLIKQTRIGRPFWGWWLVIALLAGPCTQRLPAADIQLPLLKIGTDVFTNVTVYQMTETDIFVRHERGFGNAKISNLDDATLRLLGRKTGKSDEEKAAAGSGKPVTVEKVKATLAAVNLKLPSESAVLGVISRVKPTPQLLVGGLAVMLIGYLFTCLVLKRVCVNAGSVPGVLVWFPVLQMFPLLRAARIPAFWFVIFLIPGLNLLAHILWSMRISRACGKGTFVAVLLILPVTNILALLYLAFSSRNEQPAEKHMKPEDLPGLAGA
jgi:hypothetical protein